MRQQCVGFLLGGDHSQLFNFAALLLAGEIELAGSAGLLQIRCLREQRLGKTEPGLGSGESRLGLEHLKIGPDDGGLGVFAESLDILLGGLLAESAGSDRAEQAEVENRLGDDGAGVKGSVRPEPTAEAGEG